MTASDDLLSLSTTYWEPGLGPRQPRHPAPPPVARDRADSGPLQLEEGGGPTNTELDKLMHQAMAAVNTVLNNIEKEKG